MKNIKLRFTILKYVREKYPELTFQQLRICFLVASQISKQMSECSSISLLGTYAGQSKEKTPQRQWKYKKMRQKNPIEPSTFKQQAEAVEKGMMDEVEHLENDVKDATIETQWNKALSNMLMEELTKTREQCNRFKDQITEVKAAAEKAVLDENQNWSIITGSLKENQEKELLRKQKEICSLHDLLAGWIIKYLDLEKNEKSESSKSKTLQELIKNTSTPIIEKVKGNMN
eukprot:TRINITY_DN4192_c0_g1_i1.p1 TRINITY_DN4192_c0_g1~~TRINITY_DN4192_c0_g1_i1.p1  ORF type:complete len:230 (-),score=35.81 TRINITY_DN4192_c0_g1_i1:46-735(-)